MKPITVFQTPPSAQLSVLSPSERHLTDPGMEMWAGIPGLGSDEDCSEEEGGEEGIDDVPMVCDANEEGCGQSCDDSDVVREADMEWENEEGGEGTEVKVKMEEEGEEKR